MIYRSVGIIGGTNGMGSWLATLLRKEGYDVHVIGRKTEMKAADAARRCHVVVVSVPIAATAEVIASIGPLLAEDQMLMDLTSLKKAPVEWMLSSSVSEVVGCHPLFGPSVEEARGNGIVLCRGRGEAGYAWIKKVFEQAGYTLLERTPDEHDRMMSVVQVLNHFNTIVFGMTMAQSGLPMEEIRRFSTPMFRGKMDIVKKVMADSPEMYADIIAGNPHTEQILARYQQIVEEIRNMLASGDSSKWKDAVKSAAKTLFR